MSVQWQITGSQNVSCITLNDIYITIRIKFDLNAALEWSQTRAYLKGRKQIIKQAVLKTTADLLMPAISSKLELKEAIRRTAEGSCPIHPLVITLQWYY